MLVALSRIAQRTKASHVLCTGNLCTKSGEEYVRSLGYNAHIVRGDLDGSGVGAAAAGGGLNTELPESKMLRIGELQIGLIHGHQIVPWGDSAMLANHARAMGVDVLVHGHSHQATVAQAEGSATLKDAPVAASPAASPTAAASSTAATPATSSPSTLLLNPGSLTGAYSPFTTAVSPSFLLLAIQGPSVLIYTYELSAASGEVQVTKSEWRKAK